LQAKFSQEYCLAAPLVRGKLGLAEFDLDAVQDPAIREMMSRIDVAVHPDLSEPDSVSFSSPAIIEVETHDGRTLRKLVREMKGHPRNPLAASDIEAKFVECGVRVLKKEVVQRALEKIHKLDQLSSLHELMIELRPPD